MLHVMRQSAFSPVVQFMQRNCCQPCHVANAHRHHCTLLVASSDTFGCGGKTQVSPTNPNVKHTGVRWRGKISLGMARRDKVKQAIRSALDDGDHMRHPHPQKSDFINLLNLKCS